MKNQGFLLLISFSLLCLSACTDTPPPVAEAINPCRPYSLTMTRSQQNSSFSTIVFFDAKGTDTIRIEKKSPVTNLVEYQVVEYDSAGLPSTLTRYHSQNFILLGSYQMTWWEEGLRKKITEYDEQGILKKIEQYGKDQYRNRVQTYRQGSLYSDISYLNTYTPEGLLLSTSQYNQLSSDTSLWFSSTYDSEGRLTSYRYDYGQGSQYNYTVTFEYDAEDRVILETFKYDTQDLPTRIEIEYLNGELEIKRNRYDQNNEYTNYELFIYDEFKNLHTRSYFNAKTNELISSFEYGYVCDL